MSLKAFHIIFILASTLLALGFCATSFRQYLSPEGVRSDLFYALGSGLAVLTLLAYGKYFLRKLKHISYL
jgi:hypothetical protein